MTRDITLGGRGEEALALLYRFNALTVSQYYLLAEPRDALSQRYGSKSRGNPAGRRLSANADLVRRWIEQGVSFDEVAIRMDVRVQSVESFARNRGLRERVVGEEAS